MTNSVRDAMTRDPRSIGTSATVVEAARLMREEHIGSLPITDDERLVGMITDRDITTRVVAEAADLERPRSGTSTLGIPSVLSPTKSSKRRSNSWPATKFGGCPLSRTAGSSASLPRPTSPSVRTRRKRVSSSRRSLTLRRRAEVASPESRMSKPRIFLGSSGKQAKLLQAITRGLKDVADVEPWTTTFNPGRSTLDRLVELSQEVDFAAFVFAQDDWTTPDASQSGQASPRDNVVFEAGLFGGALGIRRTFILHANDSKLPSDLLGLTASATTRPPARRRFAQSTRSSARRSRPRVAAGRSRGCGGSSR